MTELGLPPLNIIIDMPTPLVPCIPYLIAPGLGGGGGGGTKHTLNRG